jgi:hypothetical protein
MFGFINKLFSAKKNPTTAFKSGNFKLGMEALEIRDVPSAASGAMHTVAPPVGHLTEQISFYIDANNHLLRENSTNLNGGKNTPSNVKLLSAGHDANGGAEVFVTAGDGSFWKWDAGTWTKLLKPTADKVEGFAAVDGGRAYAILENVNTGGISLQEYTGSSFHKIPVTGTPASLDAITIGNNMDTVFVKNTNGSLLDYQQFDPGSSFLSDTLFAPSVHSISHITDFSAGLDQLGRAEVYATFKTLFGTSSFSKNLAGASVNSWQFIADGSTIKKFSATDDGAVWVIGSDGSIFEYDLFGHKVPQTEMGSFARGADISAATSQDVFFVATDGSMTQWVDSLGGAYEAVQVDGPGTVQL